MKLLVPPPPHPPFVLSLMFNSVFAPLRKLETYFPREAINVLEDGEINYEITD